MGAAAAFAGIDHESLQRAGRMVVSIEGMWCASCALAVERILARSPGVISASTSFSGGSALVRWDPAHFSLEQLVARVEKLGYRVVPLVESQEVERQIDAQARAVWLRLAVAAFFSMWSMLASFALYLDPGLAASPEGWWLALASCAAALPVVTYAAWDFYRAGWRTLRAGVPGMDALVSLGVLASCLLSAWALWAGSTAVYVDTATMLVVFLLCGRVVELYARRRNSAALDALRQAVPETARRIGPDGVAAEVAAAEVRVGDRVLVHAGERISVDGVVLAGVTEIDRALVTGESMPVAAGPGDRVEAGSINLSYQITVGVEHAYGRRFIDRIGIRMLELLGAKSAVALQAERFARWLIPAALALSALVLGVGLAGGAGAADAAMRALSVLVAACPCAVGLALPLAYAASAAAAARHGILFRDPASLEALAGAREILFDKTGTLTAGVPEVTAVLAADPAAPDAVLYWAAVAETGIAHPIAQGIRSAAGRAGLVLAHGGSAQRDGQGSIWRCAAGGDTVLVGNARWMDRQGVSAPPDAPGRPAQAGTRVEVARNGVWIGALQLQDCVREDAGVALAALAAAGLSLRMVTGDSAVAALPLAAALGIASERVHAGCLPEQKAALVAAARQPAVFVGDGVNDALALAAAGCGVAVQGASTAAVATAGVVIASGGLHSVVAARRHARRTVRIVRQNLAFSMLYNVAVLALAAGGTVAPVAAAGAMLASSISVMANAARLGRMRP